MSPSQFHANRDTRSPGFCPPPLKINKSSHSIKKSSSLSSSSSSSPPLIGGNMAGSTAAKPPPQHRHPVIIYTHSPKVIHTHPRDFMALVQKLTGLSRPEDAAPNPSKPLSGNNSSSSPLPPQTAEDNKKMMNNRNNSNNNNNNNSDDNESSSVITDEFGSSSCNFGDGQVNSRGVHHPNLCNLTNNVPVFASNSADFYGSSSINNQPTFYGYNDSFLFSGMRTHHVPSSSSSSSSAAMLEGLNEFRDY